MPGAPHLALFEMWVSSVAGCPTSRVFRDVGIVGGPLYSPSATLLTLDRGLANRSSLAEA